MDPDSVVGPHHFANELREKLVQLSYDSFAQCETHWLSVKTETDKLCKFMLTFYLFEDESQYMEAFERKIVKRMQPTEKYASKFEKSAVLVLLRVLASYAMQMVWISKLDRQPNTGCNAKSFWIKLAGCSSDISDAAFFQTEAGPSEGPASEIMSVVAKLFYRLPNWFLMKKGRFCYMQEIDTVLKNVSDAVGMMKHEEASYAILATRVLFLLKHVVQTHTYRVEEIVPHQEVIRSLFAIDACFYRVKDIHRPPADADEERRERFQDILSLAVQTEETYNRLAPVEESLDFDILPFMHNALYLADMLMFVVIEEELHRFPAMIETCPTHYVMYKDSNETMVPSQVVLNSMDLYNRLQDHSDALESIHRQDADCGGSKCIEELLDSDDLGFIDTNSIYEAEVVIDKFSSGSHVGRKAKALVVQILGIYRELRLKAVQMNKKSKKAMRKWDDKALSTGVGLMEEHFKKHFAMSTYDMAQRVSKMKKLIYDWDKPFTRLGRVDMVTRKREHEVAV